MSLTITTLIENSLKNDRTGEQQGLKWEHGLSFLIEKDGVTILFDTGQTDAFLDNAEQLGKDLRKVNSVVISHSHYDHAGGFPSLIDVHDRFHLYMGNGFFRKKYSLKNEVYNYNGAPFDEDFLKAKGIEYSFIMDDSTELIPGLHILTSFFRCSEKHRQSPSPHF